MKRMNNESKILKQILLGIIALFIITIISAHFAFGKFEKPACGKVAQGEVCEAIGKVADKLNKHTWSAPLNRELKRLWNFENVEIYASDKIRINGLKNVKATVYSDGITYWIAFNPDLVRHKGFDSALLHELFHVADVKEIKMTLTGTIDYELEYRALKFGLFFQRETPKDKRTWMGMKWKDKWDDEDVEKALKKELKNNYKFDGEGNYNWRFPTASYR